MKNQPKTSDIVITSKEQKEQADKLHDERDRKHINEFYSRIETANELAGRISDRLFSENQLSAQELIFLKSEANEYKGILEQIILDPKLKLQLRQTKNNTLQTTLTNRMQEAFDHAIKRLSSSISVIDTRIEVRKIEKPDPVENTSDSEDIQNLADPIIKRLYCLQLFECFQQYFPNETEKTWVNRFVNTAEELNPITSEDAKRPTSNKLVILGMLKGVHEDVSGSFVFDSYVKTRWGIKNYAKTKNDNEQKAYFKNAYDKTKTILSVKKQ